MKTLKLALIGMLLTVAGVANASLIYQSGSYTYYEDVNGLEWVYASPCAGVGGCGNDVTLIDDFRFPTELDWNTSFVDLSALITAFEIDLNNTNACASAYFGSGFSHCDFGNVTAGYVWGAPTSIASSPTISFGETFLVRNQARSSIPEPTTLATLALGLLALRLRRKA
ncbi:PEP-CTERM sorting domain-containing protein [Aliiglaciecola sp. SL4]|uniref:PEP-CTERM sorting domain-containing protein n=1 Tax=Aliiglaciecola sp. SL4 TaxID=3239806 RepID=UPI00355AD994